MTERKLPVNIGGETGTGEGGALAEATLTFTPGGVYIDVAFEDVHGVEQSFPTIGFDRKQLSGALVGENLKDVFDPERKGGA